MAKRKAPCPRSRVQPSALEGEGSCHREQMEPAGVVGPFCSGICETKPRVRKESLKGIQGRHRECAAEITWEPTARWLGCLKEDHPWDPEGVVQSFCNLKVTEHCYIGSQSERKTHSTRAEK